MTRLGLGIGLFALLSASAPRVAHAAPAYDRCTGFIASLPHVIQSSGTWCLATHLVAQAGPDGVIRIEADDVTLDCNGFRIDGSLAGQPSPGPAVYAAGHGGLTIRRCHLQSFDVGILIEPEDVGVSARHRVEDNRLDRIRQIGVSVIGDDSVVRGNRVNRIASGVGGQPAFGILTQGSVDVIDNVVSGVSATGSLAVGISSAFNAGGSLRGNRVQGIHHSGVGATAYGIRVDTGTRAVVRDNVIVGEGQSDSIGLVCDSAQSVVARDNSLLGFATALSGCTDSGNLARP